MKNHRWHQRAFIILALSWFCRPVDATGMKDDDPVLANIIVHQLESFYKKGGSLLASEIHAWIGKDLHKLWLKHELEYSGETEENEWQFLYNRTIDPNWDLQIGWRHDIRPNPKRNWLAVGFQGQAPYELEVSTTLFVRGHGQTAVRLKAEKDWPITQRWILVPNIEINAHSKNDPATMTGAGFTDLEASLRLRYAINPQIAPYIGLNWEKKFDKTADFARQAGESSNEVLWGVGVHLWF